MADWSKLPYDIIHKVSTFLVAIEDFLAFSAVCHSWQSVYLAKQWHLGPQVPMLMFSDYENSSSRSFISLYRNKVYNLELPEVCGKRCWGSTLGWLVTIGDDLKLHLLNPFTRVSVCLPPKASLQINFGEIHDWYGIIQKAFVFKNPCTSDGNEEDLLVLIIYGPQKQLAFCRPGYSSWRSIKGANHVGFIDVACLKDQIFALRGMGTLVAVDIETLTAVDVNGQRQPEHVASSVHLQWGDWEQIFLVESCGDLWIVYQNHNNHHWRYSIESMGFLIYSFDFDKKRWIKLSDLGNCTVFVGDHCSAATYAPGFLNCKCNHVYFVGTRTEQGWPYSDVHVDLGVYSMAKGRSERLRFGADAPTSYSYPLWVTPTLH